MEKTFLLGVGCQKGGTTWVHDHLFRHPHCALGIAKEYHTFDVVASEQQRHMLVRSMKRLRSNLEKAEAKLMKGEPVPLDGSVPILRNADLYEKLMRNLRKVNFALDHADYVSYFSRLAEPDEVRITGDITPEYAVLKAADYAEIRKMIEARGDLKVKVLFMMRDPIERIFSSEKMNCRRLGQSEEQAALNTVKKYKHPMNAPKSQFENTIRGIEQAFDAENILYLFYEEMFKSHDVSALYDFLGLERLIEPDFGHNPLPSGKVKATLPEAGLAEMRAYFAPTYDFVAERFGKDRIAAIWKHF
jgi:hypothetical protein